ncbi:hypothetical protein FH608_034795 [Nonomuraea phyllanthi]|uniref:Uncharacterized protein n=1 Tax=Nonomuraea phyllanthi TaxID=2219224 RepID=A0A5C4VXZ9_9ACTN|nr:hypothetical protein [Nonomuraea phyllanthi]KAB8190677.1 hypothetical protein FH608_034795 [Nonomuraea phyllanthi]QFY05850.1 hypothetical protein GBF35_03450 [Nonomuraea phyllanthi]
MTSVAIAARDNAGWCDTMCRAHGLPGTFGPRAWTNPARTPTLYPDAVTLSPDATAADVLPHIDSGPGASVKDSFATLDLPGFEVLFEAQWIFRAPPEPRPAAIAWEAVKDAETLRDWEQACFAGGVSGLFPPALLEEVTIVCGRIEGDIVCGSVLSPRDEVVGVSNVFASGCDMGTAWEGTLSMAAGLFPGRPLVGWEIDPADAVRQGFTTIGPLRVWSKIA